MRKQVIKVRKGKSKDLVTSLHTVAQMLQHPKLKKKWKRHGIEILRSSYSLAYALSIVEIDKMIEKAASEQNSVKQFYIYNKAVDALERRMKLVKTLTESPVQGITLENMTKLSKEMDDLTSKREKVRTLAREDQYSKGMALLNEQARDKQTYRNAYYLSLIHI